MRIFLRIEIEGIQVKIFQDGTVQTFHYKGPFHCKNKIKKWRDVKGSIRVNKNDGYVSHHTHIGKDWIKTARLIALHLPGFDRMNRKQSIDHINRDSLDNRLENLRISTPSQQSRNREMNIQAKGCYPVLFKGKIIGYKSLISIDNKKVYLGWFKTYEEGHNAYLQAVALT